MSGPSIQPFFPCAPDYMSWEDWNGNLAIYYGEENIVFSDELNWKNTANSLSETASFGAYPTPDPNDYDEWQKWAKDFTEIVNGQSY
jgi:hypothetical protein